MKETLRPVAVLTGICLIVAVLLAAGVLSALVLYALDIYGMLI